MLPLPCSMGEGRGEGSKETMDPFLYKDWLDEFRREVDDEVERMRRAPTAPAPPAAPAPAAPAAAAGLRAWWDKEVSPPPLPEESLTTIQTNRELDLSRQEVRTLNAEVEKLRAGEGSVVFSAQQRVDALSREKAALEEQLARAAKGAGTLKALQEMNTDVQEQLAGMRDKMVSIRAEYEARGRIREEHIASLEREKGALEAALRMEREARLEAEKTIEDGRKRLAEAEAVRGELAALRSAFDSKLESAAEFLEAKIRSVQEQNRGRQA